ncbi:MAG: tetratricopeptide repeat protein [Polyangia bacterium]
MDRRLVIQGLLVLVLATPALALGAVHAPVLAVYVVLAAGLLAYLGLDRRTVGSVRLDLPGGLILLMIGFTALQLVPLPAGLVELISPAAHEVRSRALEPLGSARPGWMPLTLDVPITLTELGKLLLYLAVYWSCLAWSRRQGSSFVLSTIIAAGVSAAAVLLAHKVLLLDSVYGFYEPMHLRTSAERISAPLINENHMAALLGLCACIAIGRAISAADQSHRLPMVFLAALVGGALLLTLSRGGIAAFVAAQLVFVALMLVQRARKKHSEEGWRQVAWLPLGLALSLALGIFAAQDAIIGEFVGGSHRKIEMLGEGMPLIERFWAFGAGRGAFWVGFPLVSDWAANVTFTHAENAVVQLLADYGIPVGAAVLVGFAVVATRRLLAPPRRAAHVAGLAALVGFGIHNLVDFNVEIPGVAVIAVAILAAIQGGERSPTSGRPVRTRRRVPQPILHVLAAAALGVGLAVGLWASPHSVDAEERRLLADFARGDRRAFSRDRLRATIERHPASWYIPFIAGVEAFRSGEGRPLVWLSRALEINPSSAAAHFHAGRVVLSMGNLDQAMLELCLAARNDPGLARHAADLLVRASPSFESLEDFAREPEDEVPLWNALADALARRNLDEEAEAADLAVLGVDPLHPRSLARHARRLSRRGEHEKALRLARRLEDVPDKSAAAAMLAAEIHRRSGEPEKAVDALSAALRRNPRDESLLRRLARAQQRAGDHEAAMQTAARLKTTAITVRDRAAAIRLAGDLELVQGRVRAALARYRKAHSLRPGDTALLKKIADLAEKHGDVPRALEALRKLNALEPERDWGKRLKKLEMRTRGKSSKLH